MGLKRRGLLYGGMGMGWAWNWNWAGMLIKWLFVSVCCFTKDTYLA
jgi:hypothetical protein